MPASVMSQTSDPSAIRSKCLAPPLVLAEQEKRRPPEGAVEQPPRETPEHREIEPTMAIVPDGPSRRRKDAPTLARLQGADSLLSGYPFAETKRRDRSEGRSLPARVWSARSSNRHRPVDLVSLRAPAVSGSRASGIPSLNLGDRGALRAASGSEAEVVLIPAVLNGPVVRASSGHGDARRH